jgi:hypothetical protein
MGGNLKNHISIKSNRQELDFLKRYLVLIQISQLVGSMFGECHNKKTRNKKLNIARQVGRLGDYGAIN